MPVLTTSLHRTYQPKLDVLWACREIGSNAIDGEERNKHLGIGKLSVEYSKRTKTLTIRNEGVTVPTTALLMGTSESRGDETCIGQFGEGLPMALLVLARSDIPLVIYNGDEKWEPSIERSEQYDNEPVLCIKTRKMLKSREGFEVQIQSIEPEEYESFCSLFLRFDKNFDPTQAVTGKGGQERVLLSPIYNGKVYNKGVFVQKRGDLLFGYDLHGELNRDRSFMDEWSLKTNLGTLLSLCISANGDAFLDLVSRALFESTGVLEVNSEYSNLFYSDELRGKVCEVFLQKYGESTIAVDNLDEVEAAHSLGLKAVVCSPLIGRILKQKLGTLESRKRKQQSAVVKNWPESRLTAIELSNLTTVRLLVQAVLPAARDMSFEVVSFGSAEVKFLTDVEKLTVRLGHSTLLDFEEALIAALHGALTVSKGDFNSVPLLLCRIINQLTQGTGAANALALTLLSQRG